MVRRIVFDIEANRLENPDKIWVIVCKDIDTQERFIFRNVHDIRQRNEFIAFADNVELWIGHNVISYDLPVLERIAGVQILLEKVLDTLVISRLIDYPRDGHSIEAYGEEFGYPKIKHYDFTKYSQELETYCIRDVDICELVYRKYLRYISNPDHAESIKLEHEFQTITDKLHEKGFAFDIGRAEKLLSKVSSELQEIDEQITKAFPAKLKLIREITPKATKYGTISLSSIPKALRENIHEYSVDAPFSYCGWVEFNPSSHKQLIEVLTDAGWHPVDKTKTHIDAEREFNQIKYRTKDVQSELRFSSLKNKLDGLKVSGWKINEHNLDTLPASAPKPSKLLAKRILLESRRRTLTEWLELVQPDNRIHGKFYGIGAWTHRMAHQNPNTANIPNEFDTSGKKKLYGKELRSLWRAPKNRLLVGVDAEGIQLRIFAHYIDDPEFTEALVNGRKEDKTDPHSLNQRVLGDVCRSRAAAKRYIYALLLGAGQGKLREILDCSEEAAREAYDRLLSRYTGFARLKETIIPRDAKRGWFVGLDGRRVRIPGETEGSRRHLAMSGYLQNGEAVVMKKATVRWWPLLPKNCYLVNFVHDEWQTETPNDVKIALHVAKLQADSLQQIGEELKLKCPLAGSYWNDDLKDYTIGTNWSVTH